MVYGSSDEDEDVYTNSAARLKVLKTMKPDRKKISRNVDEDIIQPVIPPDTTSPLQILNDSLILQSPPSQNSTCVSRLRAQRLPAAVASNNSMNPLVINVDTNSTELPPIVIDDDDDDDPVKSKNCTETIDCDLEVSNIVDDDYTMDIKVRWRSREIERLKLGINEKFTKIFQYFAQLENVPENQILLTRKDIPIHQTDTPASVNLQIIDILEGGIVDTTFANTVDDSEPKCKIKVQSSSSTRHFLSYDLGKSQSFQKLIEYCGKEKNVSPSNIKLFFDGEVISPTDTPESLDLDDEACFDLKII